MKAWGALLTPPGRGGVAVFGVWGPGSAQALATVAQPHARGSGAARDERPWPEVGRVALVEVRDPSGAALDEALLVRRREEAWELCCHAGPGVAEAVAAALEAAGVQAAAGAGAGGAPAAGGASPAGVRQPHALRSPLGNWSTKWEGRGPQAQRALALLPQARGREACQLLPAQAGGALDEALVALAQELAAGQRRPAQDRLTDLLARARWGLALTAPPSLALVGLPNAGKSSLMNSLLARERVLVSPVAGTTRDAIGAEAELDGLVVRLLDTAGQRASGDPLEAAGVERARAAAAAADLRLVVLDVTALDDPAAADALGLWQATADPRLALLNKFDLIPAARQPALIRRWTERLGADPCLGSALTGVGLDLLRRRLREALVGPSPLDAPGEPARTIPLLFAPDQVSALSTALRHLEESDLLGASLALTSLL